MTNNNASNADNDIIENNTYSSSFSGYYLALYEPIFDRSCLSDLIPSEQYYYRTVAALKAYFHVKRS